MKFGIFGGGHTFRARSAMRSILRTASYSSPAVCRLIVAAGRAGTKDISTCELVGYAMGTRVTQTLAATVFWKAARNERPTAGLIHHSDRGGQYCANDYQKLVKQFGIQPFKSRLGSCNDDAPCRASGAT